MTDVDAVFIIKAFHGLLKHHAEENREKSWWKYAFLIDAIEDWKRLRRLLPRRTWPCWSSWSWTTMMQNFERDKQGVLNLPQPFRAHGVECFSEVNKCYIQSSVLLLAFLLFSLFVVGCGGLLRLGLCGRCWRVSGNTPYNTISIAHNNSPKTNKLHLPTQGLMHGNPLPGLPCIGLA